MAKRYPEGIYFNFPSDQAPEFVIGKIAIKSEVFLDWLNGEAPNEKGYVYFDVLKSKDGKPYCAVNDFKPNTQGEAPAKKDDANEEDTPF